MSGQLDFKRLVIERFPGFKGSNGFSLDDLVPGVNVIYGPNGSGKTTVAKVMRSLLWPETSPDSCLVNGEVSGAGGNSFLENENGSLTVSKEGPEPGLTTKLPPSTHADRYYLSLHELLQKKTRNENLAEIIARESAGGYDVSEIEAEFDFRSRPSNAGRSTDEKAKRTLKRVNELEDRMGELRDERRSLETLEGELEEARKAKRRVDFLEDLIAYRKLRDDLVEARSRLDSFPDPVKKIKGDEATRIEEISESISRTKRKKEKIKLDIDKAKSTLDDTGLPDESVDSGFLNKLESQADRLKSFEDDLEELNREIAEQERVKDVILSRLGGEFTEGKIEKLDITAIHDLAELARDAEEVRTGLKAYDQLSGWLQEGSETGKSLEKIREGKRYLEDWLRSSTGSGEGRNGTRISLALGIIHLLSAAILAPLASPLFVLLLIPAGGFLWLALSPTGGSKERKSTKERYLELGLGNPDEWTESSVRSLLRDLSLKEAETLLERKKSDFLTARKEEIRGLRERRAELQDRKAELIERYGVAPDIDEAKLYWLVDRLNEWEKADETLEGLIGRRKNLRSTISALRRELGEELKAFDYDGLESSTDFRSAIRDLRERKDRFVRAKDRLTEAKERKKEAETELEELRDEREKIYGSLSLEVGDRASLREYSAQKDDYRDLLSEVREREAVCSSKLDELRVRENYEDDLLEKDIADLEKELESLKARAEKEDGLFEQINRIEERIRGRKNKRELEMARADLDRALQELEDQLFDDYRSLAGSALVDYLKDEGFGEDRPEVLERGGEIFTRVTRGEYDLLLEGSTPPSFKAVDTRLGKARNLDELSSGTRLQLLMSVRMAFVEKEEKGLSLPLVMDEVLANSDDVKAQEIIDLALEFSRAGRQVFYLTAQGDEVAKWREKLDNDPSIIGKLVDLSEARNLDESVRVPESRDPLVSNDPPQPGSRSHREYGNALGVAPIDHFKGAGSVHLWYLVEDVKVLYRLLEQKIDSWGQLKALIDSDAKIIRTFDEAVLERVEDLGYALERYLRAWKIGRNRPIDRSVLEETDAVTDNFIDDVADLARGCNGDPEELIHRLERGDVSGFRTRKKDELEEYFNENGYLSRDEKLTEEEILDRVLAPLDRSESKSLREAIIRLVTRLEKG